jgi:hypothetical protein
MASQRHVVHREVITNPKRVERLRKLHAIRYSDGTSLVLSIREAGLREHVRALNGYNSLISEAERAGKSVVNVMELQL